MLKALPAVANYAVSDSIRQIKPRAVVRQHIYHAQAMQFMDKAPNFSRSAVQNAFALMPKGGVSEIVR